MPFARVTYPPPPPTSNILTLQERNQFVRSTKKIGKVLGSTPHLFDDLHKTDPVDIDLTTPPSPDKTHLEIFDRRVSNHKRPGSSSSYSSMSTESTDTWSSFSSSRSISSYTETINSTDSWRVRKPTRKPPPLLRLTSNTVAERSPSATASVKPTLETIPGTPPSEIIAGDGSSGSQRYSPKTISFAAFGPPKAPSFDIPSETSLRWAKMERLKRRLGDGVPAELVFPSDNIEVLTFHPSSSTTHSIGSNSRAAASSSTKALNHSPKSSFSFERPLFAIVEGPDDHITGCFDFGRREKDTFARGHGTRRA